MPELIDKIELKAKVRSLNDCRFDDEFTRGFYWAVDECVSVIDREPTIDAEPVRHGRWIENGEIFGIDKYKCSLCSGEVDGLLDNTKYCCFCGAKMDWSNESACD